MLFMEMEPDLQFLAPTSLVDLHPIVVCALHRFVQLVTR